MADRWKNTGFEGMSDEQINRSLLNHPETAIQRMALVKGPMFNWAQRGRDLSAEGVYREQVMGMSSTMSTADAQKFSAWLKQYPTMDPRTAVPLAIGNIEPLSIIGQNAAQADIAARIAAGIYGMSQESTGAPGAPGVAQQPTPDSMTSDSGEEAWWQTVADNLVPDKGTWLGDLADNVTPDQSPMGDSLSFASRTLLTTLQSGRDAWEAVVRSTGGGVEEASKIGEKYGLTTDQIRWVQETGKVTQEGKPRENFGFGQPVTTNMSDFDEPFDSADAETRKKMLAAREEYRATDYAKPDVMLGKTVKQTALGQVLTDKNVRETLVNDKGSWLPPEIIEQNKQKVAQDVWDIRTPDEIARGVTPQAWTPGRQLAHVVWDADEQMYHTMSGAVDFANALVLDPVNAIPVGAAGKIPGAVAGGLKAVGAEGLANRVPGALTRAMADTSPAVVEVTTRVSRDLPATRRGLANTKAARSDGAPVINDGRLNAGPYGQYVTTQGVWDYLKQGRGARMVDELANDGNAASIWMKSGQRLDYSIAQELANAQSPEAVRAVLGIYLGKEIDSAKDLGTIGSQIPGVFKYGQQRTSRLPGWAGDRSVEWQNRTWRAVTNGARGKAVALDDSNALATELHAIAVGAGARPEEIADHLGRALAPGAGRDRYGAIYGEDGFLSSVVVPALVRNGVGEDDAKNLITAFDGGLDGAMRDHWNTNVAFGGGPGRGAPTLISEDLGNIAVLPSYREILRAGSKMKKIRETFPGNDEMIGDALDEMTSVWRKNVLVRPAYALREVGEMAFSMSLSGYDSYFTHPIQMIALAVNIASTKAMAGAAGHLSKSLLTGKIDDAVKRELRMERMEAKAGATPAIRARKTAAWAGKQAALRGVQPIGKTLGSVAFMAGIRSLHPTLDQNMARVNGDAMFEELQRFQDTGDPSVLSPLADAMSTIHGNFYIDTYSTNYARSAIPLARPVEGESGHAYARALADRLRRGASDKTIRDIADPNVGFDDVVADYTANRAAATRQMMGNSRTMKEWADPAIKSDEDFVRAQEDVVKQFTNNDPELLEALATGKFRGKDVDADNRALVEHLKKIVMDDPDGFPPILTTMDPKAAKGGGAYAQQALDRFNDISNEFFESVGEFSDIFARGPLVRQAYVRRVKELGVHMSPEAKAEIVANLRKAGDVGLAREVQAIPAKGNLGVEEVDLIAARFAKKESQRIFYDAAQRQNWAYALRVVSPFAQATANTFKRWGLMSMQNPQFYYRSMKPLTALTQPGSAAIYGTIDMMPGDQGAIGDLFNPQQPEESAADGFFYRDRYGERKFAYPAVGAFAQMFGADPSVWVAEGSAANLNIAGTTLNPGFGPMMTFPASFVLGDIQHEDSLAGELTRIAFPYGLAEKDQSVLEKALESFGNTFQRKSLDASDKEKQANLTMMVVASLAKSGDYDLSDTGDVNRMNSDAEQLVGRMSWITSILGTMTPSTFNPKILVEVDSPEGQAEITRHMLLDKLGEEFQKYTADDYKAGVINFAQDYGTTALFGALPRTQTDYAIQATNDMWRFATDNPEAYKQNIEVIGLFMSNDDLGSNFAREQYTAQKVAGERRVMRPNDYTTKVNETIGWMLWNQKTKEITQQLGDGTDEARAARAQVRDALERQYPGFSPSAKDTGRIEETIMKIEDALDDEAIQSLPSYFYVKRYIDARRAARSMLQEEGGGTGNLNTKGNADVALALRSLGDQYARQDTSGGFRNMWNRILTQELYDPEEGETDG
jgi:hypothetical protein